MPFPLSLHILPRAYRVLLVRPFQVLPTMTVDEVLRARADEWRVLVLGSMLSDQSNEGSGAHIQTL